MRASDTVTFYLHPKLRRQAENGNHNFISKIAEVLGAAGMSIAFDGDDAAARLRAMARPGRGLYLMQDPVNSRGLVFRKTYLYPFWHIEKEAARWEWPVAKSAFDPNEIDPRKASNFYRFWRNRLFDDAARDARRDGFVFVPLQGKLLERRSFQQCSPIDMLQAVLSHETKRQVVATLHPNETYSAAEEEALRSLFETHDRFFLQPGGSARYLQNCDYVVTQNSSVGFIGLFYGKPLVLFAKTDFHHIALNVAEFGAEEAISRAPSHAPDCPSYLYWFLQEQAINAGRPEAKEKIKKVLRGHGWPV
ncbi:capsular polysaccharide export protein, LipB/KpsS family [Yoonia litorea]|nr:hypothetical protein [Yoonia litorea]